MSNILKRDASVYEVESHIKGEFYTVNIDSKTCTCPHYQFRMKKFGGECKHIIAVRDFIAANTEVKAYKSKYKGSDNKKDKKNNASKNINKKNGAGNENKDDNNNPRSNDITLEIIREVEALGETESVRLLEKYGEVLVNDLIDKGYLTEKKGIIRLMK